MPYKWQHQQLLRALLLELCLLLIHHHCCTLAAPWEINDQMLSREPRSVAPLDQDDDDDTYEDDDDDNFYDDDYVYNKQISSRSKHSAGISCYECTQLPGEGLGSKCFHADRFAKDDPNAAVSIRRGCRSCSLNYLSGSELNVN